MATINYLNDFNIVTIILRLSLALVLGGTIGIDREMKQQSAGIRTHSLVALGSCLIMLIGIYNYNKYGGDVTRMGAQVVSGIGFLGVGTIIVSHNKKVRGLTTAAGLWTCGAIGLAIGSGFLSGGIITCIFATLLLKFMTKLDMKVKKKSLEKSLYIELDDVNALRVFETFIEDLNLKVISFETMSPIYEYSQIALSFHFVCNDKDTSNKFLEYINNNKNIIFYHKLYI